MQNNRGDFMSPGGLEFDGAEGKIYWTLLIDGLQRVLLFTPVKYVADTAYEVGYWNYFSCSLNVFAKCFLPKSDTAVFAG